MCLSAAVAAPSGGAAASPWPEQWNPLCAPCHGVDGAGDGPAADLAWPRPTDLIGEPLKFGADRAALSRSISQGVPGTLMPAFGEHLSPDAVSRLVDAVMARRGEAVPPPPNPPAVPADLTHLVERGARVWREVGCARCHGADGRGPVGPIAESMRRAGADLYDLRRGPLKRGDGAADLFATVSFGRPGTPMPGGEALPVADRWALVAYLRSLRTHPPAASSGPAALRLPPPGAPGRARDEWWPISHPSEAQPTGVPATAAGDPTRCGLCHPRQYEGWRHSRHARATGPGLIAQYHGATSDMIGRCNACHAPLAGDSMPTGAITCASCHVRAHRKHGPPGASSMRLRAPGLAPTVEPRFARSDLCLPCHNLPTGLAVDGSPLLDTWREWAQSDYLPAGIQCQHCHQPDGDHHFAGAHDARMAQAAVKLELLRVARAGDRLEVDAEVANVGAGHHFPTTATPRAVLRVRQLGRDGPIAETTQSWAIGRTVERADGQWRTVGDTRIPAGASRRWRYREPLHAAAERVELSLHLFPDWFYAGFFRRQLARTRLDPAARAEFAAALADAEGSVLLIDYRRVAIPAAR